MAGQAFGLAGGRRLAVAKTAANWRDKWTQWRTTWRPGLLRGPIPPGGELPKSGGRRKMAEPPLIKNTGLQGALLLLLVPP